MHILIQWSRKVLQTKQQHKYYFLSNTDFKSNVSCKG